MISRRVVARADYRRKAESGVFGNCNSAQLNFEPERAFIQAEAKVPVPHGYPIHGTRGQARLGSEFAHSDWRWPKAIAINWSAIRHSFPGRRRQWSRQ